LQSLEDFAENAIMI